MKIVIFVIGNDSVGIVSSVSKVLAERNVNILNLKQTIIETVFSMVIIGEAPTDSSEEVLALQEALVPVEKEKGVQIKVQHMDIFKSMHQLD